MIVDANDIDIEFWENADNPYEIVFSRPEDNPAGQCEQTPLILIRRKERKSLKHQVDRDGLVVFFYFGNIFS